MYKRRMENMDTCVKLETRLAVVDDKESSRMDMRLCEIFRECNGWLMMFVN